MGDKKAYFRSENTLYPSLFTVNPFCFCRRSTVVVQLIRNQQVRGSNPLVGLRAEEL